MSSLFRCGPGSRLSRGLRSLRAMDHPRRRFSWRRSDCSLSPAPCRLSGSGRRRIAIRRSPPLFKYFWRLAGFSGEEGRNMRMTLDGEVESAMMEPHKNFNNDAKIRPGCPNDEAARRGFPSSFREFTKWSGSGPRVVTDAIPKIKRAGNAARLIVLFLSSQGGPHILDRSRDRLGGQQAVVFLFQQRVPIADAGLQQGAIEDGDMPAPVLDGSLRLE